MTIELRLYVVFHGLISLIEEKKKNRFRAVLLSMDDHRVAAGHFLTERTLPRGASLTLEGVQPGGASLDPKKNIIVNSDNLNTGVLEKYRFAEIFLPKPRKTYSFCGVDVQGELKGDKALATSTMYSATQVFEYVQTGGSSVQLTGKGFTWSAVAPIKLADDLAVATVHIYNEPELDVDAEHAMTEFNRSCEVFNARLSMSKAIVFPSLPAESLIPSGMLPEEIASLQSREINIVHLLADRRRKVFTGVAPGVSGNHICGPAHGSGG